MRKILLVFCLLVTFISMILTASIAIGQNGDPQPIITVDPNMGPPPGSGGMGNGFSAPPGMDGIYANATQYAIDKANNPELSATMEGCFPGLIFPENDAILAEQIKASLQTIGIQWVEVNVGGYSSTTDCINITPVDSTLYVVFFMKPADFETLPVQQLLSEIATRLTAHSPEATGIRRIDISVHQVDEDHTNWNEYRLNYSTFYASFMANYADGLQGLELFTWREM